MGIFTKHHRVYIETMDIHSTNPGLASPQLKVGENGQSQSKDCSIASEVPVVASNMPKTCRGTNGTRTSE